MFGDHAAFIVPAYVVSLLVFLALIAKLRLSYSSLKKELARLDSSGIKRRSAKTKDPL